MTMDASAHQQLREQAAAYVLGALNLEERVAFETHLAACSECEAEMRSLSAVAGALAQVVPQVEPPVAVRERVLGSRQITGSDGSTAGTTGVRSTPFPAPWLSGLAVAASVAVAAALGWYALQLRARVDLLEARLQDAISRAQASESQIADARRVSSEAQSQLAVLTAPDVMRVDLAGLGDAPSATARAFWSRSRGLVLAASNLPELPPGRTYQLWFVTGTQPTSAGVFGPDNAGGARVFLTVDPNVSRPDILAVTIEPAGGGPAPTSPPSLAGKVEAL